MWSGLRRACLVAACCSAAVCASPAQNPAVTVSVDVQGNRHPINPLIYGVNLFENANLTTILQDLNAPINRYGGNRASTYNWNTNSDNRGNDYFFESISDDNQTAGERVDTFVTLTRNGGAEPMITIPMLAWVAKAGTAQPYPCSYPKTTFATQYAFDPFNTNCGDGLMPDGTTKIGGADPTLAYVANTLSNQQTWAQHVIATFGQSANGGVRYYVLDNEHDLWWSTHHDAVSQNPSYTQDRDGMISYAAMIKALDANALVVGPEMSGWIGYILSPADFQYAETNGYNFANFPDRNAMGGSDYAPWLLGQFKAYADAHNGQRLLDYFTVHYYPQGGDKFVNTRSLWDATYLDPSYINDYINLIPRMKSWVAANYPGTKIGITEYNWCDINNEAATDNIGCAIAQADVLGIFGREGLDMATRFNAPVPNLPSYNAMKMYRNYDGSKSTFGDMSVVAATAADPNNVAAFAAQRTGDSKLTVMLLSKYAAGNTAATVQLVNFPAGGTGQVWQLSGAGSAIQHLADTPLANSSVSVSLPPQSITLLVISGVQAAPAVSLSAATINFGAQRINTSTASSSVTLTNSGTAGLTINSIAISGGLAQGNNCPATLAAGANCVIAVSPTALGDVAGTITITDNAADSPQTVPVFGRGDLPLTIARVPRPARSATQTVITGSSRISPLAGGSAAGAPITLVAVPASAPDSECKESPGKAKSTKRRKHATCEE